MPRTADSLVVFDVNLRQGFYNKEIICNSMKRCNILKINDGTLFPFSMEAMNAAVKLSPAPTVSATSTFGVGWNDTLPGVNT